MDHHWEHPYNSIHYDENKLWTRQRQRVETPGDPWGVNQNSWQTRAKKPTVEPRGWG